MWRDENDAEFLEWEDAKQSKQTQLGFGDWQAGRPEPLTPEQLKDQGE